MYEKILLAYDGSVEGRLALREGAQLARLCGAEVFLLAVVNLSAGIVMAEGAVPGAAEHQQNAYSEVLDEGVEQLKAMGFTPTHRLEFGDPASRIAAVSDEIEAGLVVVGHRQQSAFARWWRGSVGASLHEQLSCSLLIAQQVSDT